MDILRKLTFLLILAVVCLSEEPIVDGIGIYGNDTFDDWTLSRLMDTRENKFYSFILGGRQRLDQRTLEKDVTRIRDYYIQEGFLDISVAANVVIRENGQKAIIHIDIKEGTRYYFKRYSIGGDGSSYFSKLGRKFTLAYQKPFNPGLVETDRMTILREAQNRGHPYAEVKSDWEKINGDSIEVRFHVKLDKKADFGQITYKNLTYTKRDFLDREVVINTGNPYSFDAITKTRENLYRTGLFNVVRVKADTSESKPDSLDMALYLFEKEPRWLAVKAAVITDPEFDMTSDLTVEWGHRNIGGRGIGLAARIVPSFRMISQWDNISNRVETDLSFPYVYKVKVPVTLSLYVDPKNRELTEQYDVWLLGGSVIAKYSKRNRVRHQLSFSYDRVAIKGGTSTDSLSFDDISIERKINYTIERDSRDNYLFPSDGTVFRGANEFTGTFLGGDEHYNKTEILWRRYMKLRKKIIYAWRIKGGYIASLKSGEEVSPHNRFVLGGANTIRGFKERSLGPKSISESGEYLPDGGNFYALTSFELRFPIYWRFYGQVFTDIGNLWTDITDARFSELKVTAGPGIAVATPVGPIRLDYGFQIVNPAEGSNKRLHLSILYAF